MSVNYSSRNSTGKGICKQGYHKTDFTLDEAIQLQKYIIEQTSPENPIYPELVDRLFSLESKLSDSSIDENIFYGSYGLLAPNTDTNSIS